MLELNEEQLDALMHMVENDDPDECAPFYDVEDEACRLCEEVLAFGLDRGVLQRALSKAYAAGLANASN